jgi:hypothetical protein
MGARLAAQQRRSGVHGRPPLPAPHSGQRRRDGDAHRRRVGRRAEETGRAMRQTMADLDGRWYRKCPHGKRVPRSRHGKEQAGRTPARDGSGSQQHEAFERDDGSAEQFFAALKTDLARGIDPSDGIASRQRTGVGRPSGRCDDRVRRSAVERTTAGWALRSTTRPAHPALGSPPRTAATARAALRPPKPPRRTARPAGAWGSLPD